jgi:hypothetical protein
MILQCPEQYEDAWWQKPVQAENRRKIGNQKIGNQAISGRA